MKGIYKRPVSCSPCIDMDWMTPETCAECERLRREEVDILQLGVGFFANKAIIKRPDGTLATVLLSELTIMVDTRGLKKSAVLAALYNASKPQGLGFLHFDPVPMTEEEAEELLRMGAYFDYLKGRVMKVDLSNDDCFEEWLYDRDNGNGAAQRAINQLRGL